MDIKLTETKMSTLYFGLFEVRIGERAAVIQRYIHKTQRWRVKFSDGTVGKFSSDAFGSKPTPECYQSVLKGLTELSESGQWPVSYFDKARVPLFH